MKYLLAVLVAALIFNLNLFILREDFFIKWLFLSIPALALATSVYYHFFSPKAKGELSFAFFWGSLLAFIMIGGLLAFFLVFKPFK